MTQNPIPNVYPKLGTAPGAFVVLEDILLTNYQPYDVRDVKVTQELQFKNGTLLATLWWTAFGAYAYTDTGCIGFKMYFLYIVHFKNMTRKK